MLINYVYVLYVLFLLPFPCLAYFRTITRHKKRTPFKDALRAFLSVLYICPSCSCFSKNRPICGRLRWCCAFPFFRKKCFACAQGYNPPLVPFYLIFRFEGGLCSPLCRPDLYRLRERRTDYKLTTQKFYESGVYTKFIYLTVCYSILVYLSCVNIF